MSNLVRLVLAGVLLLLSLQAPTAWCDEAVPLRVAGIDFVFATPEQGRAILTARDEYVQRLSPFDRQSRLQRNEAVDEATYLEFIRGEVRPWESEAQQRVSVALRSLGDSLSRLSLPSIPEIQLIHTTGREESGAAYTRGTAIILPRNRLAVAVADEELQRLVAHELFHVISRRDRQLRDQLYAVIGFQPSNEIQLPAALADRRITNPDAPVIEHVLNLKLDDTSAVFVAPVLFADAGYDPNTRASMFDYLSFQLLQVERDEGENFVAATHAGQPLFHSPTQPDFVRRIGRNTTYIIHPEEILADNFAMMVTGKSSVPDPWVIEGIRAALTTTE